MKTFSNITNALSFDIEDWFHLVEIDAVSDPAKWPTYPSLVVEYTHWILETLAEAKVRATFFILGWIARQHSQLIKTIADAGHELGSHSYWHQRIDRLTPKQFHTDLKQSIDVIEQLAGRKVLGFRAPSFSITPGAEWAFDVMHDAGLLYDSSLFPVNRGHGGYPCLERPHSFDKTPSGRPMPELPISIMALGPLKIPFSGGGYLRSLPYPVIRHGFNSLNRRGLPTVVYLHPRDFAVDCPRVKMSLYRHFKCYTGLKSSKRKLKMLLERYKFDTCSAVLGLSVQSSDLPHPPPDSAALCL